MNWARIAGSALFLGALGLFFLTPPGLADETVTACDQESLQGALDLVEEDGVVNFSCDGIIVLTNTITIMQNVVIDGTGHTITISGGTNAVRLFTLTPPDEDSTVTLTLLNVLLADGVSTNGGAVYVDTNATFIATNCVFSNNVALASNGLAGVSARTNATASNGADGRTGGLAMGAAGGAVYNLGSNYFVLCTFLTNSAIGGNGGDGGSGGSGSFTGGDGGAGGRGGRAVGGAICNLGGLSVQDSTFNGNQAVGGFGGSGGAAGAAPFAGFTGRGGVGGAAAGAAIFNFKNSISCFLNSTFALNGTSSGDSGDAQTGRGTGKIGLTGPDSAGGAIANLGTNTLINCTFFANAVVAGGGGKGGSTGFTGGKGGAGGVGWGGNVFSGGKGARSFATNCTFSDGGAHGGTNGLGGDGSFPGAPGKRGLSRGGNVANSNGLFAIKNCIFAYPGAGTNGYGKFTDGGHNLSSDRSITLDARLAKTNRQVNLDPKLDLLRDNGGPVQTLALLPGSPAIDHGDTNGAPGVDARGVARPNGTNADIGAYEFGQRLLAPEIVTQPVDQLVQTGGSVTFRVVATGDPPLFYQWRHGTGAATADIDDATNSTYTIDIADADSEGDYEVVVSNNSGSTTSDTVTLSVLNPPSITDDPQPVSISLGDSFTLTVAADGDGPLRFQWFTNGVAIPGAVLTNYTVVSARMQDAGEYTVRVCNDVACVFSATADVIVATSAPTIVAGPTNQRGRAGTNVSFLVRAAGSLPMSFFWTHGAATVLVEHDVPRATSSFAIANAQPFTNGVYQVVVSNAFGAVTGAAVLEIQSSAPTITTQPVGGLVTEGNPFTLSVTATGSTLLLYQWYVNNAPLSGATASSLVFTNVTGSTAGSYYVTVGNSVGTVTSVVAQVDVQLTPPILTQSPADAGGYTGETITLNATFTGSLLSYQWFFNTTTALAGATNTSLTLSNAQLSDNGAYFVVATNVAGAATSAPASVTLTSSVPVLLSQPISVVTNAGTNVNVTFSVSVVGSQPMYYSWYFADNAIFAPTTGSFSFSTSSGTLLRLTNTLTGSSLTVVGVRTNDEGSYRLLATNSLGSVQSDDALLDVINFGQGN